MALPDATSSAPALEKNQIPCPQNEAPHQAEEAVSSRKAWTRPVGLAALAIVLVIAAVYGYRAWQFG